VIAPYSVFMRDLRAQLERMRRFATDRVPKEWGFA